MKTPATCQTECTNLPILSSQNQGWENILVEQFQHPPGEGEYHYTDEHTISLSLAPRPVRLLQIQGGKTYAGLYGKGDYLLQQRIEKAKQLLKQTERSIIEIAFLCGFNSHSHLSKQFRQLTGMTPTGYREN